jgi:hypothetical protein
VAASKGRLAVHVYATNDDDEVVWFGPDDDVPAWAAEQITNPDAWETAPKGAKLDEPDAPAADGDDGADEEPPLGGPGSGTAEWKAYAESKGIDVPEDAGRDDIVALVRDE